MKALPDTSSKFPFAAGLWLFFIGIFALLSMLYIGRAIIVPVIFATIIAILLHPVVNFLTKHRINRLLSIIVSMVLTTLIIFAFASFLISQISKFTETWPALVEKFAAILDQMVNWTSQNLDISPKEINAWMSKTMHELINTSSSDIGTTLINVGNGLVVIFLIPVYIFMILFYQPLLLEFFRKLFGDTNRDHVSQVISQIKTLIQKYLTGLIMEAAIMAVMNSAALLLLGIQYAILLGVLAAVLNVIPYLGGIIAVAMPMVIALATKSSPMYAVYVLVAYYIIQLIDNNYIVPKIVASKVQINALVSIIVILAFGALWGIPGMFISIPLTAIVKLIFDHIEPLKPWGYLLGDTMPSFVKMELPFVKKKPA